ncbi:hypothetical protein [Mesorhizobium sp.]|uniref:hypothetical protein n=1 Tax=Mesorhizobium sp. TaxID=1871066 RepID=UPI003BAC821C
MRLFRPLVRTLNSNPLVLRVKYVRDVVRRNYFRSRASAEGAAFADALKQTGSTRFCFVVAFNTPWVIDAMTKAWSMYSRNMTLVVIDNSSNAAARDAIGRICVARGIKYFALHKNPERHPSRSHGVALNWIFHHVISRLEPDLFGLLDHDCIPIAPLDIPSQLTDKIGYGVKRDATTNYLFTAGPNEPGWYFWPGFCFLKFSAVRGLDLDFTPRMEWGMDTGGGNWPLLYSHLKLDDIAIAYETVVTVHAEGTEGSHQLVDGKLFHVLGAADKKSTVNNDGYGKRLSTYIWNTHLGGVEGRIVNDF